MTKKILMIGATSAIAEATTRLFAQRGDTLYLLGRDMERLSLLTQDLKIHGAANVEYTFFEANDLVDHQNVLDKAVQALQHIDVVVIAYGRLSHQKNAEQNVEATIDALHTNLMSVVSLLTLLANQLQKQGNGTLAVISSVAGDRGRQSNYIYGTAKGALSIFLQGLRQRLFKSNVHVLTIKPGFVDTPMTADFNKGLLWTTPEKVARGIIKAIDNKEHVVYLPRFWRYIMFVIKAIPEAIFVRLKL